MKNIKDLQYVLKAEKIPERQQEILKFISEELDKLKEVSSNMVRALEKSDKTVMPHHTVIKKLEGLLEKYSITTSSSELIGDDTAHS